MENVLKNRPWLRLMYVGWLLNGIAIKLIWGWFIVPVLGLSMISLPVSIVNGFLIGILIRMHQSWSNTEEEARQRIIHDILRPIIITIISYLFFAR